ncbi:hypothetical protein Val02_28520 [Virgisporangium aliadipatigenens]|uniref:DUF2178 domain-containing protein n=1 Tax=Virgisporangium aliadipatigenens TaxID=741659 RepID=A0A8J3YLA9_9ACTN|nr:hypothetical protein [Virgisporangium aliadipatigenens]GIJ45966.1 hypothetical protein Val02_28520 [Virgisporangium aliadipatigenens]
MSLEEKRSWIYLVVGIVGPAIYAAVVLGRAGDGALTDVAYVGPMIVTILGAIVANMVIVIATVVVSHREPQLSDERDVAYDRLGYTVGFIVMSVCTVVPLGLAMAEFDPFWIANAIYLSFCVAAVASAGAKIVFYRRGL